MIRSHPAVEVAGDVGDRLALAQLDVGRREVDGWPPSWFMPTSKVTRVRRLGFSKIIASVLAGEQRCVGASCLQLALERRGEGEELVQLLSR